MNRFIIFILYIIPCPIFSQSIGIVNHEKYNSYNKRIFYDNVLVDLIPSHFIDEYYSKLEDKDVIEKRQIIDTINKTRDIHIKTRKAGLGYMYVNKVLFEYLLKENITSSYKLNYFLKTNEVESEKQIKSLIRLKKIKSVVVIIDKKQRIINITIDE